jgi:hypothetical protein
MSPSRNMQSPMRQRAYSVAANGIRSSDADAGSFALRDTLAAIVVRELSFAEFRAALEKATKRFA